MTQVILAIFWGLVLLTTIVFIHEAGHFLAARAFGVRVKEFMIGLPGPKVQFKRKETSYGVTAIPLGGYCLIAGMENGKIDEDAKKALTFISYFGQIDEEKADMSGEELGFDLSGGLDTLSDWGTVSRSKVKGIYQYAIAEATVDGVHYKEGERRSIPSSDSFLEREFKKTYSSLPWWKRIVILLAGSFSNLVVAMVVLVALLMINGTQIATTVVDTVVEDGPAAVAGIAPGDELVSVDGAAMAGWQEFTEAVQSHSVGDEIELGYLREGAEKTATVELGENEEGAPIVGVSSRLEREPVAIGKAVEVSFMLIGMTLSAIMQLFNPATFAETIGQTSSVVGISIEASSAASSGPFTFILLTAALSISIGFMNLLPIPPLDGGKIIIETLERITKKRIPVSVINGISFAGLAAMIALFAMATNADIHRYFLGG